LFYFFSKINFSIFFWYKN